MSKMMKTFRSLTFPGKGSKAHKVGKSVDPSGDQGATNGSSTLPKSSALTSNIAKKNTPAGPAKVAWSEDNGENTIDVTQDTVREKPAMSLDLDLQAGDIGSDSGESTPEVADSGLNTPEFYDATLSLFFARNLTNYLKQPVDALVEMVCSESAVWFFKRSASRRNWHLNSLLKNRPVNSVSDFALSSYEDDADSGYHTGHNTLKANTKGQQAGSAPPLEPLRIPSQDTLTREDLRRCIETFNGNQHGLIMTMHCEETSYQGFIRVHMNLIRPINMSISTRPPSIYDVMSHSEDEEEEDPGQEEVTSFYLPKDTSKVIHIECSTTTQEVIKALLTKYKITDNPRKFALYEKLIQDKKERMRRMADDEHPLQLCLEWSKPGLEGLDVHKFVLQENDTGEILWEAFSIPELENFLGILNKEEEDYAEQVKHKYRLLKIQMDRRLKEIRPKASSPPADDKRSPIFV